MVLSNVGIRWFVGVSTWIGENIYFGWNATPQSYAEQWLDIFSLVLMLSVFWPGRLVYLIISNRSREP